MAGRDAARTAKVGAEGAWERRAGPTPEPVVVEHVPPVIGAPTAGRAGFVDGIAKEGLGIILLLIAVAAGGFFAFIYSGIYDISATPHWPPVRWVIETVKRNSIKQRAEEIAARPLGAASQIREGTALYTRLCTVCHDSPSRIQPLSALGMRPPPPPMSIPAQEWNVSELFWVIKNGIKMTGMPSWGAAVSDAEI